MEATDQYTARFPDLTGTRRIHAGMVAAMDDAVGRVLAKVRALGQEENTLIFFYSDNGGPTPQTTASNEPLRGYKGQFYEGGIREPFLAQWKGKLPAGMVYREMVMGFDCHATALAAAGVPLPTDKPLDGVNLLPFLTGEKQGRPHQQLFWRSGEKHAARVGDWKLVKERGGGCGTLQSQGRHQREERPGREGTGEAQGTRIRLRCLGKADDARAVDPAGRPHAGCRARQS